MYPRFAVPTDPSGDAYNKAWEKVDSENRNYGAFMFEDDVEVLASRDVLEVFNELSADLINRYPAQLPAVILPEIYAKADGLYTFRIPVDNIRLAGTKIFMHKYLQESDYPIPEEPTPSSWIPDGVTVLSDNNIHVLTYNYSVLVNIDSEIWRVQSKDINLPEYLTFKIEEADTEGNISRLRIYAVPYYDVEDTNNCFTTLTRITLLV